MKRLESRKWKKKILYMVVLPALIATVLFVIAGVSAKRGQKEGGAARNPQSTAGGQAQTGQDASAGQKTANRDSAENRAQTGKDVPDGQDTADEWETLMADTAGMSEPMQRIFFTAGGSKKTQRSVPVQIDASILGGEAGAKRWAVFLPAEMNEEAGICYSGLDSVSMEPIPQGEYLDGARLGPDTEKKKVSAAWTGAQTFFSGDRVSGLVNGSAFSVDLGLADGSVQTEVLYVFSCTGTATMYLDTESGSMENVDADKTKNTSEKAKYSVFLPDGSMDSEGECIVSGRGNSTWQMIKRPYNLNLVEKQSILGMQECKKLCLLANTFDMTNLLDRISSQLALQLGMRDTPEGEFVNLYLNGKYNGLYFLSQRPREGGSVHIDKMDKRIQKANGVKDYSSLPKKTALHQKDESRKKWAYAWAEEPSDNTGGYLLQYYTNYDGEDCWFSTETRRFRIMSPSCPTIGEVTYLSDYMQATENALYSKDGKDPESGKYYSEFLDIPSWQDMFMLEEYFVEWDAEHWSFYIIKDRKDPLLYCGPMWDFDHSAGSILHGDLPETTVSTLMFRGTRHGWMHKLLSHEDFITGLYSRWRERFSPAIHDFLDTQMEKEIAAIESAAYMNNIRRTNDIDYREKTAGLTTWLRRRLEFLDAYVGEEGENARDNYCSVTFKFPWGNISHYVLRGEPLGYLPLPEYGETQIPSQIEKNEIIGWVDGDGNEISADIVIDRKRAFTPVFRQETQSQ